MRTTCCLAEWMPPARMRVFTGVVRPAARAPAPRVDARVQRRDQPASRFVAADDRRQQRATRPAPRRCWRRCRRRRARSRSSRTRGSAPAPRATRARRGRRRTRRRRRRRSTATAPAAQRVDQREDVRRIHPTASIKLLRIASGLAQRGRRHRCLVRAVPGAHQDRARAGGVPRRTSSRRSPTINERADRAPGRGRPARSCPAPACGSGILPISGSDRVGMVRTVVVAIDARARPAPGCASMCRARSARNGSSMIPRPMPDWLVTTTVTKPARLSRRIASDGQGKELEQHRAIEIAALLDERAVAIEEDGRTAHSSSCGTRPQSTAACTRAGSSRSCSDDRWGTHEAYRDGTSTRGSATRRRAGRAPAARSPARWSDRTGHHRHAGGRGQVHGAGVVRHARAAQRQHAGQHVERRRAGRSIT